MAEQDIQNQISELNRKLDLLLENTELQNRKREEFDDLVEDVNIVVKDAFRHTVTLLDKSQVDFEQAGVSNLIIRLLQNIGTFQEMLEMMESASDFLKDLSPIFHQVGLDAVNKMNELDEKGYFEKGREMLKVFDQFVQTCREEDIRQMQTGVQHLAGILRNLTDPALLASIEKMTRAVNEVKIDENTEDISFWKIFKEMRSREVRKSLMYSLRLIKAINR